MWNLEPRRMSWFVVLNISTVVRVEVEV